MLPAGSWGWCWARSPCSSCSTDCARRSASADGARQVRRKARSQTRGPGRSPRRSKRVGATFRRPRHESAVGREISSSGVAIRVESISSAYGCQSVARRNTPPCARRLPPGRRTDAGSDAAVVTLLRPGIRKQHQDLVHAVRGDLPLEVPRPALRQMTRTFASTPLLEPSSSRRPGAMDPTPQNRGNFYAPRGCRWRERQQVLAVAEADLDGSRGVAPRTELGSRAACVPNAIAYFGHSEASARSCAAVIRPPRVTKERIERGCSVAVIS